MDLFAFWTPRTWKMGLFSKSFLDFKNYFHHKSLFPDEHWHFDLWEQYTVFFLFWFRNKIKFKKVNKLKFFSIIKKDNDLIILKNFNIFWNLIIKSNGIKTKKTEYRLNLIISLIIIAK